MLIVTHAHDSPLAELTFNLRKSCIQRLLLIWVHDFLHKNELLYI